MQQSLSDARQSKGGTNITAEGGGVHAGMHASLHKFCWGLKTQKD